MRIKEGQDLDHSIHSPHTPARGGQGHAMPSLAVLAKLAMATLRHASALLVHSLAHALTGHGPQWPRMALHGMVLVG